MHKNYQRKKRTQVLINNLPRLLDLERDLEGDLALDLGGVFEIDLPFFIGGGLFERDLDLECFLLGDKDREYLQKFRYKLWSIKHHYSFLY